MSDSIQSGDNTLHHAHSSAASHKVSRAVLRVLWITMALNFTSALVKLGVGLISHNLTVLSDAMHGFLDGANNIVGILAIAFSWRPPDANHPYGHRKYEALAALAIGALMTLTSWEILGSVFHRLMARAHPAPPTDSLLLLALVGLGLVINILVSRYELRRGQALGSMFLVADSLHTRSDIMVTLVSLSSLLLAPRWPLLDTLLSLIVVGFILHTGWGVLRDNAMLLTDAVQMDPGPIKAAVGTVGGVLDSHAIRTHGMPDAIHLDLHIVVSPQITAKETQRIETDVREVLHRTFPQIAEVSIHHQTHTPVTGQPFTRPSPQS